MLAAAITTRAVGAHGPPALLAAAAVATRSLTVTSIGRLPSAGETGVVRETSIARGAAVAAPEPAAAAAGCHSTAQTAGVSPTLKLHAEK